MTRQKEKPLVHGQGLCKTKNLLRRYSTKPTIKNQKLLRIRALNLIELANELSETQDELYRLGKIGGAR